MKRSNSRILLKDLMNNLKKSNSHNSLKNLSELEEEEKTTVFKNLYSNLKKGTNQNTVKTLNELEDDENTIINDIIEPVSFECGNKLTDYVENGHSIDIFGDDYPIRNAMLLLLYTSFSKIKEFPKLLKNNDNSISFSLFVEFLAPILVNTVMKNLIGTGIHEFLHQTIYKIH
tara:strand:+ start:17913 stop:18431 length:519 start_codon:yes stop_codon:yes gene_type:complete